jgi:hypothetical protein
MEVKGPYYKITLAYLLLVLVLAIGVYRVETTALEIKDLAASRALVLCENQNEMRSIILTLVRAAPPPTIQRDDLEGDLAERITIYDDFRDLAESILQQQECPPDVEG